MPMASRKIPSVAPVDMVGTKGTPGKYLATSASAGPKILGSSGGATATGRTGGTKVTLTPGSPITATKAARVSSTVSPGNIRQLTLAAARCGNALLAWPPSNSVATQVVRSMLILAILRHDCL